MDTGADLTVKNEETRQHPGKEHFPHPADDRVTTYKKLSALAAQLRDIPYQSAQWKPSEGDATEWTEATPQAVFDCHVLNIMRETRATAIQGERPDINKLSLIIHLAATSMSEQLIDELFTPFWLTVWAINRKDYHAMGTHKPTIDVSDAQRQNLYVQLCRKVKPDATFVKRLLDLTAVLETLGLKESVKSLQTITVTWTRYDDGSLGDIAQYLIANDTAIPSARPLAMKALMCMASPRWTEMAAEYIEAGIRPFGGITARMVDKQLDSIYAGAEESDLIFKAICTLSRDDDSDMAARSYFWDCLMRKGLYRKEIIEHARQDMSAATRRIFDLVPLRDYTDEEAAAIGYDKDVMRFTLAADQGAADRIPYKVSNISQQKIMLIVPDIREPFYGKSVLLPIIGEEGADRREYKPFDVTGDKHVLLKPIELRITRTDGTNLPLPLSGKMEIINPDGTSAQQWEYIAQESNHLWTSVEVWPQHIQTRLLNMANNGQRLQADGIDCEATIEPGDRQERYYRQIVLARGEGIPAYSSLAMLADSEGNVIDKIDTTTATPLEYRLELFKPALDMSAASTASPRYAVYGYGPGTVTLWTDAVNLSAGQRLTAAGCYGDMRVVSAEPFGEAFAQLHVSLISGRSRVAPYGTLHTPEEEGGTQIPYVGAFRRNGCLLLRIDDPEWTQRLGAEPGKVIEELKSRTHYIGRQRVRVMTAEVLRHVPGSQKVTVEMAASQSYYLPLDGRLTVKEPDGSKPSLKYLAHARLKATLIPRLKYIGPGPEGLPLLTADFDEALNALPAKTYAKIQGQSRVGVLHKLPAKDGKTITMEYEEPGRGFTSSVLNTTLMCYCPVTNEPTKPLFETKQSYKVNDVHCRLFVSKTDGSRMLRMPAPESPIEGLYYKIGKYAPIEIKSDDVRRKRIVANPYYEFLNIKLSPKLKVEPEDTVRFFYDKQGTLPAVLAYERLLSQIELNAPWKYHADTCALIHQEANACGCFTEQVCEMLKAHSRAEMLRREYVGDPEKTRIRKYPDTLTFNVGYVTSAIGGKPVICMPSADQPIRHSLPDSEAQAGMLVMAEQNGDIYPIEVTEAVRIPQMGFRNGTVCGSADGDGSLMIRDADGEEYVYTPDGTEKAEEGTEVNFFAVNMPYCRRRKAVLVEACTEC